jgi:L-glutamine:2-deoxy-scyllo-inosose/3-amino-2,3-dideoxy-scyllo-inosose aminotransferase
MEKLAIRGGSPLRTKPFPVWPVHGEIERRGLLEVLESGLWSGIGPKERSFTDAFAQFSGASHALCVANGSISLELALRALRVGPGDEVIVPALTWLATAWAVLQVGARPVFTDVCASTWCLDPAQVRAKITPRTRAIIPVHLYNQMAPMGELLEIAREHSFGVIEDCAHAHGMQLDGKGAGTIGHIGSFSFQSSKAMTAGEGSVLTTNDAVLAEELAGLRNCGRPMTPDRGATFGSNYRITEFQAAVLLGQISRFPEQLARKAENLHHFRERMREIEGIVPTPANPSMTREGFYAVSLRYDASVFGGTPREVFAEALRAEGIPMEFTYETVYEAYLWKPGAARIRCGAGERPEDMLGFGSHCPIAEEISRISGMKLLHQVFLGTREDIDDVVDGIAKVAAHCGQLRMHSLKTMARRKVKGLLNAVRSRS